MYLEFELIMRHFMILLSEFLLKCVGRQSYVLSQLPPQEHL